MKRKLTTNILVLAGGAALLSSIVWSAVGLAVYGGDMTPNLLAELAGVSFEVAVAALIVERVMSRRQRREWDFAYRALAERSSEAFVDIMRLIFAHSSETAVAANLPRYESFIQLAEQHLGDLRSHIEGSATALDSHTHEHYRRVERRLAWCLRWLRVPPVRPGGHADLLPLLRTTAVLVFELLAKDGDGHRAELAAAESALAEVLEDHGDHDLTPDDLLRDRLRVQSALLRRNDGERVQLGSISQDVDNEYSIPYFMIDYLVLTAIEPEPRP